MKKLSFISIAVATFIAFGCCYWLSKEGDSVIKSSDAGEAISANYSESAFGAYTTRIETDTDIFLVRGTVAIRKGERFTLEVRKFGDRMLCRTGRKDCWDLAN